jgi:hypothetical protein
MIHLLTGWSKEYEPLADITFPGKVLYASKHGYQIKWFTHTNEKTMPWNRPLQWLTALQSIGENDWLFFTGCDAAITNSGIKLESLIDDSKDLIASTDYSDLQGDSMLIRNSERTRRWLGRVLAWEGLCFNEQEAMTAELSEHLDYRRYLRSLKERGIGRDNVEIELNNQDVCVKLLPQKLINAYPMEFYAQGEITNDGTFWEPGDFIAHMACRSLECRIENIPKILIAAAKYIADK